MMQETMKFLILAAMYSLVLFGAAVLVGCSVPVREIVDCATHSRDCNWDVYIYSKRSEI